MRLFLIFVFTLALPALSFAKDRHSEGAANLMVERGFPREFVESMYYSKSGYNLTIAEVFIYVQGEPTYQKAGQFDVVKEVLKDELTGQRVEVLFAFQPREDGCQAGSKCYNLKRIVYDGKDVSPSDYAGLAVQIEINANGKKKEFFEKKM